MSFQDFCGGSGGTTWCCRCRGGACAHIGQCQDCGHHQTTYIIPSQPFPYGTQAPLCNFSSLALMELNQKVDEILRRLKDLEPPCNLGHQV